MGYYTKDQLLLFHNQAMKLAGYRRAAFIHDVRGAVWAEGKDLQTILKQLLDNT